MGLLDRIRGNGHATAEIEAVVGRMREALIQRDMSVEFLHEAIAELELARDDQGWRRLGDFGETQFSRAHLDDIVKLSRLATIKNPLIRRGVRVGAFYTFGQGVEISARDPNVNEVVQAFITEHSNAKVLFGHQARMREQRNLAVHGQRFYALFPDRLRGSVKVRKFATSEIREIIRNPEDAEEVWFYERRFTPRRGAAEDVALYPDWRIPLPRMTSSLEGKRVETKARLYHVKVNDLDGMDFGIPDTYAALDWARAQKGYLEDFASIAKALSRFAWKLTGSKAQLEKAKKRLGTTLGSDMDEDEPPPAAASTALVPISKDSFRTGDLTPIPKTGANIGAEDARHLRTMVAAGIDTPDNILANDPVQGALATAKTLDRPTELATRDRQMMWTEVYKDLCGFAIDVARNAPGGALPRSDLDVTVDVSWPDIIEHDVAERVGAIVQAATLGGQGVTAGTLPSKLLTRLLAVALGVGDVDEVLAELFPEDDEGTEGTEEEIERQMVEAVRDLRRELAAITESR